jgi:FkbM family methyltransferase
MGIYSRWMARHARRVDSFECNPHLLPHLQRFLPRNVELHHCALSSAPGRASLRFDPGNTGIGTIESFNRLDKNPGIRQVESVDVEVRRLDDFQLGPVSFIKIDVEGHELEVLKGARQLLERNRPVLLIEIEQRHCPGNLKAVPLWLAALGYEPRVLGEERKLTPARDLEYLRCNNFWFLPHSATSGG